jgi:hypothetical protein
MPLLSIFIIMKKLISAIIFLCIVSTWAFAQNAPVLQKASPAVIWVDSVFKTLSPDEQIAQLMVVRLSTINANKSVIF